MGFFLCEWIKWQPHNETTLHSVYIPSLFFHKHWSVATSPIRVHSTLKEVLNAGSLFTSFRITTQAARFAQTHLIFTAYVMKCEKV